MDGDENASLILHDENSHVFEINVTHQSLDPGVPDELPPGKKFHLFVSCRSMNDKVAMDLIQQLEENFNLRCMHGNSDFQPGKSILTNIADNIELCMKFLVILTPEYIESGYCKTEMAQAYDHFVRNRQEGCMVCLKLEQCEVPKEIRHITYIDGHGMTLPEMASKVSKAFHEIEICQLSNVYLNGMDVLWGKIRKKHKVKGSRYMFDEFPTGRRVSCDPVIYEEALDVYQDITGHINSLWWMSILASLWSDRIWCTFPCALFCVLLLISELMFFLTKGTFGSMGSFFGSMVFIVPLLVFCGLPFLGRSLKKIAMTSLEDMLRSYIRDNTLIGRNNYFVMCKTADTLGLSFQLKSLHLSVVRYDTSACQEFIKYQLQEINPIPCSAAKLEKESDNFILEAICTHYQHKEKSLIPKDVIHRHPTFDDVHCLCQLVEDSSEYQILMEKLRPIETV